ncbi:hypothetical protein [Azohydromonas lata]|uniref:hypothetical protein n=1 Tax=Azohydromonas lata TaxID=45677 RepID=UPI0012F4E737|nr:hypothetical protein [Azohydromonas lata]
MCTCTSCGKALVRPWQSLHVEIEGVDLAGPVPQVQEPPQSRELKDRRRIWSPSCERA